MFDIEADDYPEYVETVPLISLEMEFKLDRIMNFLAATWGFATTKDFALSIIHGTLDASRLTIYNTMIGHILHGGA